MSLYFRERWENLREAIRIALENFQPRVWTMLPGKVSAVDLTMQLVTAQSQIKGRQLMRQSNGQLAWQDVSMPPMPMVPIKYPSGGGWTMTFPIAAGDEGTVHFAARCIDNWWVNGGEQPAMTSQGVGDLRMHSLSDGFWVPGGRSKPNALSNVSKTDPQLRSDDGKFVMGYSKTNGFYINMPNGVALTFNPSGQFTITSANGQTLQLNPSGNLQVMGDATAGQGGTDSVTLQKHLHVNAGGAGDSGKPKPGT